MLRHVNPDSHMDKCPVLTSESLGQHFYNNLGKYHKACRVRYSNSRATQLFKTKISEDLSMKPASKAAKRERHVSAHDNTNAALMSYLLRYFVEFIRGAGRVIRYLTTWMANSQPVSLTNCSCSRRPEGCPVSKQESSTNYT